MYLSSQCLDNQHTSVADMPGYPTRKLLFGFPDTLTLADAICSQILSPHWALQLSLATSPAGIARRYEGDWSGAIADAGQFHLACFECDALCFVLLKPNNDERMDARWLLWPSPVCDAALSERDAVCGIRWEGVKRGLELM